MSEGRQVATTPPALILTAQFLEREYVKNGKSLTDIARTVGCSRVYVLKRLREFRLNVRSPKKAHDLAVAQGKLRAAAVREDFFAKWSPAMAWALGILWTDGCLHSRHNARTGRVTPPRISLGQKESELPEKLRALISPETQIHYKPEREYRSGVAGALYTFDICNNAVYEDLLRLGMTPRKSLTIGFPRVTGTHLRHFVRGCWDGDGSVYVTGGKLFASFVSGSRKFIEGMVDALLVLGLRPRSIHTRRLDRGNASYYIRIAGHECRTLYEVLYEGVDESLYLTRKRAAFHDFFREPRPPATEFLPGMTEQLSDD